MISKKANFVLGNSVERKFSFEFEDGTTEEEIINVIKAEYDEWLAHWGCEWYFIEKEDEDDDEEDYETDDEEYDENDEEDDDYDDEDE